jgi:hypothetical protein
LDEEVGITNKVSQMLSHPKAFMETKEISKITLYKPFPTP